MKTQWIRSIGCILAVLILSGIMPLAAQDNAERYTTISGVVKDKLNKKKLEYVNVSIPGSSVGTVTNADGEFTLKIPESVQAKDIEASHVGYLNSRIPLKEENPTERIVWLTPYANLLSEILVRARDPRSIVEEALRKIPANYSPQSNMLTGFYRELAQKGRRYINISEAVIDIYKTPYNETAEHDRVQIYRGRRLLSQKQSDTLAVKLLGGPNMAIYMDIVKNPDCLLAQEEGIEQKNRFVSLTEGIFKIYKASSSTPEKTDQVKLLKMRRITNQAVKDTLIAKMKSGIHASIELDLIKSLPDFLLPDSKECVYVYTSSDLAVIDNRLAHVVSFEQRPSIKYPYYCGELYIDSENSALLRARFELTPRYIHKAANMLVEKRSRNIRIIPQKVVYTVSYKPWKQTYYIHHVRGDLHFKIKQKNKWLNNTILHTWFEMVTCKIETDNVSRFDHNERLSVHTIFAETPFVYDKSFWEDFNVIPPEKELSEAIEKISSKIEETEN